MNSNKYETLGARIFAAFIDGLILTFASVFIFYFSLFIGGWAADNVAALTAALSLIYYVLLHYFFGRTLGKKIAKVKVVDISEKPINFGQSVVRNLPQLIVVMYGVSFSNADELSGQPAEMLWILQWGIWSFSLVDIGFFLAHEKRRALHDLIAGTVVIRTDI